jgi:hypothetical protein
MNDYFLSLYLHGVKKFYSILFMIGIGKYSQKAYKRYSLLCFGLPIHVGLKARFRKRYIDCKWKFNKKYRKDKCDLGQDLL